MTISIAEAFHDKLNEAATKAEQNRRMEAETARELAEAGLFRMLIPKVYGGLEYHPWEYIQTLARLAQADGSAGWVVMIGTTTSMLSASLPEHWAKEIYADHPLAITVGVTAPSGKAEFVDADTLNVSGRWPFGSGCQLASWICGGCMPYENGELKKNEKGQPEPRLVFFRSEDVTIHDSSWDTSGLRGTGSHDYEVSGLQVPADRAVTLGGRPNVDSPLYRFPTLGLLALGVSAVSIGLARRAVQEFIDLAGAKTPTGASRTLANRPAAQADLARATASVEAAWALTRESVQSAYDEAQRAGRMSLETKARLRLAAANNAWSAVDAVDRLYHAAGGSSIYRHNRLQQCFRDAHVATQHVMVAQPIYEVVGKVQLGVDPRQPL